MNLIIGAFGAFVVTVMATFALRPLAVVVDLVDRPGGRKTHWGEVPVMGGLAMFLGIILGIGLIGISYVGMSSLLGAFALMVTVGLLDDRFNLSPWLRLPVQAAAAALLTLGTGTEVWSLGNAAGFGLVTFHGVWSHLISILFVMTAINAFNMLDGMDGLAGMVAALAFITLGAIGWHQGQPIVATIGAVIAGATIGFLLFNLPTRMNRAVRCFMGDAGSTLLGVALAWVCIRATQDVSVRSLTPVTALWIVAIPVFEFFWSFIRRISRGQSPLRADAEHFHHLLLRAGFSVRGAFLVFSLLALLLIATGLTLQVVGAPEFVSLLALTGACVFVVRLMYSARILLHFAPAFAVRGTLPSADVPVAAVVSVQDGNRH